MCCEYCKDLPTNRENMSFIESLGSKEFVLLGSYTDGYSQLQVNYCSICGRNLNPTDHKENEDDNDIYGSYDSYEDTYGYYTHTLLGETLDV